MNHTIIFNIHSEFVRRNAGGHRIASFLREKEWDAEVIDWADFFTLEELKEIARSRITSKTVFVGFSSFMSYWSLKLEDYTQWLKTNYPDVKIILGGQSSPKMQSNYIDYYVHGYGEFAILELVKSFVSNHTVNFSPLFTDKKVINAIHSYPAFPMKSLKVDYEKRDFIESKEWLNIEFSRGCIFKCLYCNYPILGVKGDYTRDAEDFYIEMQTNYDKWGVKNYIVADETFNDYSEKVIKYANAAEKLSFKPWFSAFLRADLLAMRPSDWEHMVRLGVLGHFYGIESFNPQTAKAIGKGGNMERVQEGLLKAKDYFKSHGDGFYRGHIALIIGLPYETFETLEKTFNWILNNWQGEYCYPFPLEIPYDPKADRLSRLSSEYQKWGYRESSEIHYNGIDQITKKLAWVNDNMSLEQAIQIGTSFTDLLYQRNFGITPFDLDAYMYFDLSLEQVLNMTVKDTLKFDRDKIFGDRFENYKNKKLSI